jgi:type I site-specific restriction endonuclease
LSRTSPTASPSTSAAHTAAYFSHKAFAYGYDQAVKDGYLVDYDAVNVRSDVRMNGVFLKEGDRVEQVDPQTGLSRLDTLSGPSTRRRSSAGSPHRTRTA